MRSSTTPRQRWQHERWAVRRAVSCIRGTCVGCSMGAPRLLVRCRWLPSNHSPRFFPPMVGRVAESRKRIRPDTPLFLLWGLLFQAIPPTNSAPAPEEEHNRALPKPIRHNDLSTRVVEACATLLTYAQRQP